MKNVETCSTNNCNRVFPRALVGLLPVLSLSRSTAHIFAQKKVKSGQMTHFISSIKIRFCFFYIFYRRLTVSNSGSLKARIYLWEDCIY